MPLFVVVHKLPAAAMAIFPFIFIKKADYKHDGVVINHEKIHFRQQLELLILPFYVLYLLHYLVNLLRFKNHYLAYFNIVFEKEAYANELDTSYLHNRKPFAWLKYFKRN